MNYDEIEKLLNEAMKSDIRSLLPNSIMNALFQGKGRSTGNSPTSVDAKGKFEYQTPQQDEQGTLYGYKILHLYIPSEFYNYYVYVYGKKIRYSNVLISPSYNSVWEDGELESDQIPDELSMHGIHCTKRMDNEVLANYVTYREGLTNVLVMCALSGTVVETEQGFRAQHAKIVGVYNNGNWTNYSDFNERTNGYSNRDAQEKKYRGTLTEWR